MRAAHWINLNPVGPLGPKLWPPGNQICGPRGPNLGPRGPKGAQGPLGPLWVPYWPFVGPKQPCWLLWVTLAVKARCDAVRTQGRVALREHAKFELARLASSEAAVEQASTEGCLGPTWAHEGLIGDPYK